VSCATGGDRSHARRWTVRESVADLTDAGGDRIEITALHRRCRQTVPALLGAVMLALTLALTCSAGILDGLGRVAVGVDVRQPIAGVSGGELRRRLVTFVGNLQPPLTLDESSADRYPAWGGDIEEVKYIDPLNAAVRHLHVLIAKHFHFAHQQEWRIIWVPVQDARELLYIDLELGSMEDCCTLLVP
jgi:hypothetical protein